MSSVCGAGEAVGLSVLSQSESIYLMLASCDLLMTSFPASKNVDIRLGQHVNIMGYQECEH